MDLGYRFLFHRAVIYCYQSKINFLTVKILNFINLSSSRVGEHPLLQALSKKYILHARALNGNSMRSHVRVMS